MSTEAHEVRNALQPPALGGSFLVRRVTKVCQSIACRSTLKPAFSSSDFVTGARLLSEAMSVDCISTTGQPTEPASCSSARALAKSEVILSSQPFVDCSGEPHGNSDLHSTYQRGLP